MIPRIEPSHRRRAIALLCGMSTPPAAEREALELRAHGLLPDDEELAAIVINLTPQQAANAAKVAA